MPRGSYSGPTDIDLEPNAHDLWAFHRYWFRHCTQGVIQIGWMDPATGGLTRFKEYALTDTTFVDDVVTINSVPGQSIYIRAATVSVAKPGQAATDGDFCQAPGIWGDQDTPEQLMRAKGVASPIRPTALVQTGMVPYPRWQSFFLLAAPLTDAVLVRDLNVRLQTLYGGDPVVINPTRLMRLPGTIAWPWKPGRVPELTRLVIPEGRPVNYELETLITELPAASSEGGGRAEGTRNQDADGPLTVKDLLERIKIGQGWHVAVIRVVAHWVGRGWSTQEILLAAQAFTLPGWTLEQTEREVRQAIDGARQKWAKPDVDHAVGGGRDDTLKGRVLPLLHFHEAGPRLDADDFVQGLLTRRSMAAFYGDSNSGKTFLVTDLCFHIAAGWNWRGRAVDRGFVLYIAGEGVHGIQNRIAAWRMHYELAGDAHLPFVVVTTSVNLLAADAGDVEAIIRTCQATAETYAMVPTVVVMDTLASAMSGGNENAPEDMSSVLMAGRRVIEELGACFIWIHHSGKDAARGARGHSSFRAALDTEIEVTDKEGERTATVTKQRDMPRTGVFKFRLEVIELGADRRGNMVTSCVVEHLDIGADGMVGKRALSRAAPGTHKGRALEILINALNQQGQVWAGGGADIPPGVPSIPEEVWRDHFFGGAMPGAKPDAKRMAFKRASDGLLAKRQVGMANGRVWRV